MRRFFVVPVALSLALAVTGCPQKKKDPAKGKAKVTDKKTDVKKTAPPPKKANPNALPADTAWTSGNTKGAALELETKLDVPGLKGEGKKGAADTAMTQTMWVTEGRGRVIFTTAKSYIPENTELRYNDATKKYVLADPAKKNYWAMTGSQLGNTLEGGPELKRSNYNVTVTDTKDKAKIAGFDAIKSDCVISFDYSVKMKSGEKSGKVTVNLAIWHSADAKLADAWGDTMLALLAIPFQDAEGQKVVDELKKKIKFPVKWAMEFKQEGDKQEKGEAFPKLVTAATKIEVKDLEKSGFAWPPAGFEPAAGPYTFGEGGQTATEDDLKKLPAKEGTPPKNVEPVDSKEAK